MRDIQPGPITMVDGPTEGAMRAVFRVLDPESVLGLASGPGDTNMLLFGMVHLAEALMLSPMTDQAIGQRRPALADAVASGHLVRGETGEALRCRERGMEIALRSERTGAAGQRHPLDAPTMSAMPMGEQLGPLLWSEIGARDVDRAELRSVIDLLEPLDGEHG